MRRLAHYASDGTVMELQDGPDYVGSGRPDVCLELNTRSGQVWRDEFALELNDAYRKLALAREVITGPIPEDEVQQPLWCDDVHQVQMAFMVYELASVLRDVNERVNRMRDIVGITEIRKI